MTISLPGSVRLRPHTRDGFIDVGVSSAPAFNPASITGLRAWWKADSLALADGAPVAAWTDSSGNGATLSQATGANQPIFKTAVANGNPVLRFAAASSHVLTGPDLSALTAGTVFFVFKRNLDPPLSDPTSGCWDFSAAPTISTLVPYSDGTIYDGTGTTVRKTTVNPTPSLAAWNVYTVTSAPAAWSSFLNGSQLFTTATNTVGFASVVRVGRSLQTSVFYDGDIGEILVYNSALGTTNRQSVETYLKAKWGTP